MVNFHVNSRGSENFHFAGLLLPKAYKDLDQKVQTSYVLWHRRVMKRFKKGLTFGSKNDMKNLVNFNASSGKSENIIFGVLFL